MVMRVSTSQSRDAPYHHPWLPARCSRSHGLDWLAASWGVGTLVSNDLLSVRAPAPVTPYSLRLSTTAGSPSGGDPISTTACCAGPELQRAAATSTQTEA